MLPVHLAKADLKKGKARLAELADDLNISHLIKKLPEDMSGGERQRVAIARAIINQPKILMLDEPTGSLDSRTTGEVLDLLLRIRDEMGVTVLQVTHSADTARVGDRVIRIVDGRVVV